MAKTNKTNKPAKTTSSDKPSRVRFVDGLAFFGLAAAAILLLVGPILRWILAKTSGGVILQILNTVAMLCMLAAIAIPAWYFVRGKKQGWKIFYYIILAVYVLATVFGVTFGIL